jgi:hypothetical protein
LRWLSRVAGFVIIGFGVAALVSLLPLPWHKIGRSLGV